MEFTKACQNDTHGLTPSLLGQVKMRQGQILRSGDLEIVGVTLHQQGTVASQFHGAGVIRDQLASGEGLGQGPAEDPEAEHLGGEGMPETLPGDRVLNLAVGIRGLHGVPHRDAEETADGVTFQGRDQTIQVLPPQTRPGRVMDQHPVVLPGLAGQGLQGIEHRMAAFGTPGDAPDGGMAGGRQSIPARVRRVQGHRQPMDAGVSEKEAQAVLQHRQARQVQVLLGEGGAHPAAGARGGDDGPAGAVSHGFWPRPFPPGVWRLTEWPGAW